MIEILRPTTVRQSTSTTKAADVILVPAPPYLEVCRARLGGSCRENKNHKKIKNLIDFVCLVTNFNYFKRI